MRVTVYSRRGCHLCEVMIEALLPIVSGRATLEVVDIDLDADLLRQYDRRVPVLLVDGKPVCEAKLDAERLRAALAADV